MAEVTPPAPIPESTNGHRKPGNPHWQKGISGNPARQWPKGHSGNPGGMSRKLVDIIRLAREASATTFELLLDLRHSPDQAVALRACIYVLDRAWGHPPAAVPIETAIQHEQLAGRSDLEHHPCRGASSPGPASRARPNFSEL